MSNLLVVDFDSFFPNPLDANEAGRDDILMYDWGHREAPFFIEVLWPGRAAAFERVGLPLPDLDGRELRFWHRFNFTPSAKLYYADSNACAVNPQITGRHRQWDSVWLYDAHHDSGYHAPADWNQYERMQALYDLCQAGRFSCEDWMVLYRAMGAKLHVRYPEWRASAMDIEPEPLVWDLDRQVDAGITNQPDVAFDRVFVCRSGAWVPPWLDIDERFEQFVAAAPCKTKVDVQPGGMTRRHFDLAEVHEQAVREADFLRRAAAGEFTANDTTV